MASKLIPAGRRSSAWLMEGGFTSWEASDNVSPLDASIAAGLDTEVTVHPIFSHDGTRIPGKVETWRDGHHGGIVGEGSYHVIQWTKDVLPFTDAITYETPFNVVAAGKMRHGMQELMVFEWPETVLVGGEEFGGFGYVRNSHDGSLALSMTLEMQRFACTNQLNGLMKSGLTVKFRHTASWATRLEEARRFLGLTLESIDAFTLQVEQELAVDFLARQFEVVVDEIAPLREANGTLKTGRGLTMAENARDSLWASWNAPDLDNVRGTVFGAKQALGAYYDWAYSSDKSRGLRALSGSTVGQKAKAAALVDALV